MAKLVEVKAPDIGDFKDVEVIEILVQPGDSVAQEQSLISLESDKATIEIPAPVAGVIRELVVKLGDKVSQGSLILRLESRESKQEPPQEAQKESPKPTPPPVAGATDFDCDMLVLGSGPGGHSAGVPAADPGLKTTPLGGYPAP